MLQSNYNPDVLTCLANLSSDEVFTPPHMANNILDLLPQKLWRDPNATFLDPVCKCGVFLREIARRLDAGLARAIPDKQQRINHIFTKQIYGLAITELTSLLSRRSVYCSKAADGKYSVCEGFADSQGNIRFERVEHVWKNGHCSCCGGSQENYERGEELETHAYQFIHTDKPEEIFDMKFDVIIGNPPYQLAGGGHGRAAMPIYNLFVEQAKKLSPRYLSMIIPARWYAGGRGLDNFRAVMLNDKRVRRLVDFQHASEVFPGVDVAGGICYFLWDRDNPGDCEIVNKSEPSVSVAVRPLDEFNTLIRSNTAVSIVRKVLGSHKGRRLSDVVLPSKPFGLRTFYEPKSKGVPCWFIQRIGKRFAAPSDITDEHKILNKWKFLAPKAPIAGQTDFSKPVAFYYDANTRIAAPGECCTESFIVLGAFDTKREVLSYKSYIYTKVVRFLLLQAVVSQDVTKKNFYLVPDLGRYEGTYTDDMLVKRWKITRDEWEYIDSKIRSTEATGE